MSKVNVEAGQWWTDIQGADPKHRLLVRGLTQTGHVICEWNGGSVSTLGMNYFLQYKKPLPKCTGWDWEPMIYPQYRETTNTHDFAYVRVDGPRRVTYILIDGTPEVEQWSSAVAVDNILARPKLTKEQAEALVTQRPDDWVVQDKVRERVGIDQWRYVNGCSAGSWRDSAAKQFSYGWHGDVDSIGPRLELRCRRKELPTTAESRVKYPQYWSTHNPSSYAYLEQLSETEFRMVRLDGSPEDTKMGNPELRYRVSLTKEQAEMKIVDESMSAKNWFAESAAEPKEVPTLPLGPCHELLGPNDVPDSTTEHNYTDCNTGWRKTNTTCWFELGRTVEWYQVNKYSTVVFRRPVKPPTTRTVRVHIVEMSDGPDARFVSVGTSDSDLARMRKNWKTVHVLKTDEYEVSCE